MRINEVISPAQARLNLCSKDYVRILTEVNQAITEESRADRKVWLEWPAKDISSHDYNRAAADLREYGFSVSQEETMRYKDGSRLAEHGYLVKALRISW